MGKCKLATLSRRLFEPPQPHLLLLAPRPPPSPPTAPSLHCLMLRMEGGWGVEKGVHFLCTPLRSGACVHC